MGHNVSMKRALLSVAFVSVLALAGAQGKSANKDEKLLAQAKALYTSSKAAYTKKPKDAKLRKGYIDATISYGTISMNSPVMTPKQKYPQALRLYREALKLDPKNEIALNNKKMIESIYKSMNRPVPQ